jgi:hypothetical protein
MPLSRVPPATRADSSPGRECSPTQIETTCPSATRARHPVPPGGDRRLARGGMGRARASSARSGALEMIIAGRAARLLLRSLAAVPALSATSEAQG